MRSFTKAILSGILFMSLLPFTQAQPLVETITVKSDSEVSKLRENIVRTIWPGKLSDLTPTIRFTSNVPTSAMAKENYPWLQSVSSMDKLTITLKNRVESHVYILHPTISNRLNIPVIYHGGHGGGFWEDKNWNNEPFTYSVSVYKFFLDRGFDVICFDMPLRGVNPKTYQLNRLNGPITISEHEDFFKLGEPFYYFFEPIRRTLDYLELKSGYHSFAMLGLSGGGWATTVYSAIDTRIKHSYAVAGSTPLDFRTHPNDWGDLEQNYKPFYDAFNYSTLYTLAAAGKDRLHYQVLLKNDQCCFAVDGSGWAENVKSALAVLSTGGKYEFLYDTYANKHMVSSVALDSIYHRLTHNYFNEHPPIDIRIANSNKQKKTFACRVDSLTLENVIPGEDAIQWFKDVSPLNAGTGESVMLDGPGLYFARVENISGIAFYSDTIKLEEFPRPKITQTGTRLQSNFKRGNQWYLNGIEISGSTEQFLEPKSLGKYTVKLTAGGCTSAASDPYYFGTLIYPNPVTDRLVIQLNNSVGTVNVQLFNTEGHLILADKIAAYKSITLPLNISNGMYILRISGSQGFQDTRKIFVAR